MWIYPSVEKGYIYIMITPSPVLKSKVKTHVRGADATFI